MHVLGDSGWTRALSLIRETFSMDTSLRSLERYGLID